jgi:hypothetical protein
MDKKTVHEDFVTTDVPQIRKMRDVIFLRDKYLTEHFQWAFRDLFDPSFVRIVIQDFWKMEAGNSSKKEYQNMSKKEQNLMLIMKQKCPKNNQKIKGFRTQYSKIKRTYSFCFSSTFVIITGMNIRFQ